MANRILWLKRILIWFFITLILCALATQFNLTIEKKENQCNCKVTKELKYNEVQGAK